MSPDSVLRSAANDEVSKQKASNKQTHPPTHPPIHAPIPTPCFLSLARQRSWLLQTIHECVEPIGHNKFLILPFQK